SRAEQSGAGSCGSGGGGGGLRAAGRTYTEALPLLTSDAFLKKEAAVTPLRRARGHNRVPAILFRDKIARERQGGRESWQLGCGYSIRTPGSKRGGERRRSTERKRAWRQLSNNTSNGRREKKRRRGAIRACRQSSNSASTPAVAAAETHLAAAA
ncbi:unnamed protein product, partial [Ectocarpus fasciculatus]